MKPLPMVSTLLSWPRLILQMKMKQFLQIVHGRLQLVSPSSYFKKNSIGPLTLLCHAAINGYGTYRLIPGLVTPSPTSRRTVSASLSTLHVPHVKLPALPRLYSTNWTPNIASNSNGMNSRGIYSELCLWRALYCMLDLCFTHCNLHIHLLRGI